MTGLAELAETYKNSELVEELGCAVVVAAAVLELAEFVECVNHLNGDAVVFLEVVQVGHLVAAEVVYDVLVGQEVLDLAAFLLVLLALVEDILSLLHVLLRSLVEAVDLRIQVSHKVRHVGLLEQLKLELSNVSGRRLVIELLEELQQREDEVTIEVGDEFWENGVFLCNVLGRVGLRGSILGHVAGDVGLEFCHDYRR